ncbi:hypothetical protein IJ135_00720, partial [Candidatus Saccharibacteria bacterium]|nr:hypothetical protein [Candidatus Saccharibacteria bacterium]
YHGAKDPDELIQKDPALWQAAVEERMPAVDWVLQKYEDNLNLRLAPDKKQYSDVALSLLENVKDEIERAAYEEKVAEKLGVPVEILREKGSRLNKKIEQAAHKRYLKKPKTTATPSHIKKIEDSLLALKIFGGIVKTEIPLPIPTDDTRLSELEMIFTSDHEAVADPDYEKEAADLLTRYNSELKKHKIAELNEKLLELEDDDPAAEQILAEITKLQKE